MNEKPPEETLAVEAAQGSQVEVLPQFDSHPEFISNAFAAIGQRAAADYLKDAEKFDHFSEIQDRAVQESMELYEKIAAKLQNKDTQEEALRDLKMFFEDQARYHVTEAMQLVKTSKMYRETVEHKFGKSK